VSRTLALSALLPELPAALDRPIGGLVMDSRAVRQGDAFVAIAGFGAHGLTFVEQARAAGASAILFEPPAPNGLPAPADAIAVEGLRARLGTMADQFHGHPSTALTMIGVTGTNGKTSTVQLIAQALELLGTRTGTSGTLGVGLYGHAVPTGFTTPLVLQMHQVLAQLRDDGAAAVAMEVSSHALDQGRVDAVHYDVAVFTNLTRDHLDYHGDMASYGAAKARLFHRQGLRAAVVNIDDAFGAALLAGLPEGVRPLALSSRGDERADIRRRGYAPRDVQGGGVGLGPQLLHAQKQEDGGARRHDAHLRHELEDQHPASEAHRPTSLRTMSETQVTRTTSGNAP